MKPFLAVLFFMALTVSSRGVEHALSIDKIHSRIEVAVTATMHEFTGKLNDYDADILVDTTSGKLAKAMLRFKFADLKTGDEKRDNAMLSWENNDQFPEAVFTLISLNTAKPNQPTARGQLLLHGTAQEITVELTIVTKDQLVYSIDGESTFDIRDFGLPVIRRYGFLRVNPVVTVSFHLQGSASEK